MRQVAFSSFLRTFTSARIRSSWNTAACRYVLGLMVVAFAATTQAQFTTPSSFTAQSNGNFTGTIPIRLPPATGGLAPSLAISYDSHNGNGLLGVGWTLSGLSAIVRCPRTMAQDGVRGSVKYDANDRYCLDGARLIAVNGAYGADGTQYRTELESFAKITSHLTTGSGPKYFTVQTKSGLTKTYGNTSTSGILALGSTSIRVWALSNVADPVGNNYSFTYTFDSTNGAYYPSNISFTANGTNAAQNAVNFTYQNRTDAIASWTNGAMVKIVQRLYQIQVLTSGGQSVRAYTLQYDNNGAAGNSRLTSLKECTALSGSQCLPAVAINWGGGSQSVGFATQPTFTNSNLAAWCGWKIFVGAGDFNGDGRDDLLCWYAPAGNPATGQYVAVLSNGNGSFSVSSPWPTSGTTYCYSSTQGANLLIADFDGDGRKDLLCPNSNGTFVVAFSKGDGTFTAAPSWPAPGTTFCAGNSLEVADVDGDGRADLICVTSTGYQVALSNGDGTFSIKAQWPHAACTTTSTSVGDFNGDGLADLVIYCYGASGPTYLVAFSNGDVPGTFTPASAAWSDPTKTFGISCSSIEVGDFNGDGRDDIACFTTGGQVLVAFSKGDGTFAVAQAGAWPQAGKWCQFDPAGVTLTGGIVFADFNGDGKQDMGCDNGITSANHQFMIAYSNGDGTFNSSSAWYPSSGALCSSQGGTLLALDLDGNGSADMVCTPPPQAGVIATVQSQSTPDLVTSINDGVGRLTSASYLPLSNVSIYTKDTGANAATYPTADVQRPYYVTSSVAVSNGIGGNALTNYAYGGLKADLSGRGSLGFRWVTTTNAQTSISFQSTYRQDFPYTGMELTLTETIPGGGNAGTLRSVANTLGCTDFVSTSGCTVTLGRLYFPYISQILTSSWDLNGAPYSTQTTNNTYGDTCGVSTNTFGNLTQVEVTTSDGYSKTTCNYYKNDTTHWWIGQLLESQVTSTTP